MWLSMMSPLRFSRCLFVDDNLLLLPGTGEPCGTFTSGAVLSWRQHREILWMLQHNEDKHAKIKAAFSPHKD